MGFTITIPPNPAEDEALDLIFQALVTGVTGMDGDLVRGMWQNPPPKQPERGVDWCSVGVFGSRPEAGSGAYTQHLNGPGIDDPSSDLLIRHEELEVMAAFYGPNAKGKSGILRDGLFLDQNREALKVVDIAFVGTDPQRAAPEFVNQQWIRRWDLMMRFNRKIQRVYTVQNIVAAIVHIFDDTKHIDRTVVVPPGTVIVP